MDRPEGRDWGSRAGAGWAGRTGGQGRVDDDADAWVSAEDLAGGGLEGAEVVLDQPIAGVLVRGGDSEVVAVERGESARTKPGVESARGQSALEFGEHAVP